MAIVSVSTLKNWFRTALKPTQQQFWDWLDSYWHKLEPIPMSAVSGLDDALTGFASQEDVEALKAITIETSAATASAAIPAGVVVHAVRVKSTAAQTINIGTTTGGSQVIGGEEFGANVGRVLVLYYDNDAASTMHFSGLSGNNIIKIYLLQ